MYLTLPEQIALRGAESTLAYRFVSASRRLPPILYASRLPPVSSSNELFPTVHFNNKATRPRVSSSPRTKLPHWHFYTLMLVSSVSFPLGSRVTQRKVNQTRRALSRSSRLSHQPDPSYYWGNLKFLFHSQGKSPRRLVRASTKLPCIHHNQGHH